METSNSFNVKDATIAGFKNLFNPKGCTGRAEYWWWVFVSAFLELAFAIVTIVPVNGTDMWSVFLYCTNVTLLPVLLLFCAQIRRFHDAGKSARVPVMANVCYVALISIFAYICVVNWEQLRNEEEIEMSDSVAHIFRIILILTIAFGIKLFIGTLRKSKKD